MKKRSDEQFAEPGIREWLSVLDGLRQENIVLKNRLSDAVRRSAGKAFVEEAETLQQWSVEKDQLIDILRHDIANLLIRIRFTDDAGRNAILLQQVRSLEEDMQKVAAGFEQMKKIFDHYLAGFEDPGS